MSARRVHVALLLALLPVASACGSVGLRSSASSGGKDPVASAATKTGTSTSMRLAFTGSVQGTWANETFGFSGTGVADTAAGAGRMHFRFRFPPEARAELGANPSMDMIFRTKPRLEMYMRSPMLARLAPGTRPWLKFDLTKLAAQKGVNLNGLTQMNQADPSQNLQYLMNASKSRELGWDRVRGGTLTKHYALTVDLRKLAGDQAEFRAALRKMRGLPRRIPAEAWIDEHGFLRKLTLKLSLNVGPDGPIRMKLSEEFYGFGVRVRVQRPAARLVTDASKLLNR
jgi:hypothetical protein